MSDRAANLQTSDFSMMESTIFDGELPPMPDSHPGPFDDSFLTELLRNASNQQQEQSNITTESLIVLRELLTVNQQLLRAAKTSIELSRETNRLLRATMRTGSNPPADSHKRHG